jgi:hypothetical protein
MKARYVLVLLGKCGTKGRFELRWILYIVLYEHYSILCSSHFPLYNHVACVGPLMLAVSPFSLCYAALKFKNTPPTVIGILSR